MIRYALICDADHESESWFRDSASFDQLSAGGQLACPSCGSTAVRKAVMAPSVVTATRKATALPAPEPSGTAEAGAASPPVRQPVAILDDRARELRAMMRELHRRITTEADNVGRAFASEARAIHEGSAPPRSIYGEATRDEVRALIEDEVPLMPLPSLPDDQH